MRTKETVRLGTRGFVLSLVVAPMLLACNGEEGASDVIQVGEVTVDLDFSTATLRSREALAGNFVADAIAMQVPDAQVVLVNAGALRFNATRFADGIFPAGPVTDVDVADMLPFDFKVESSIDLLTVTGAQLTSVLERAVSSLNSPNPSHGEETKGWFLQVAGVAFVADTTKPAQVFDLDSGTIVTEGERVSDVTVGSEPLDPAGSYTVACRSFMADGSDGHVALTEASARTKTGKSAPSHLADYLEANSPVTPTLSGRITLR